MRRIHNYFSLQKPYSRTSFTSETPIAATKSVPKQVKNDYLRVQDPVPSTSKAKQPAVTAAAPDPNFKMPKPRDFNKSNITSISDDDDDSDDLSTVSTASSRGNPYSHTEEEKIVKWIIKNHRYKEVGGIAMWRLMESDNAVPGRSSQSMKERFRKKILQKIDMYDIGEDAKNAFKQQRKQSKKDLKRLDAKPKKK